jgi:hypothetical protein
VRGIVHKSADVVEGMRVAGGLGFVHSGGFVESKGVGMEGGEILGWKRGEIQGFLRGFGGRV